MIRFVDEDGTMVIDEATREVDSSREGRHWLVSGREEIAIRTPAPHPEQQWAGVDVSARWVVWKETTSFELGPEPWVMYALDRATWKTHELARSPLVDGRDPTAVPGYTGPVVLGEQVFWAQTEGTREREKASLYRCAIAHCKPVRVLENAAFPSAGDEALFAIHAPDYAHTDRPSSMSVVRIDPVSGRVRRLRTMPLRGVSPSGFAANDTLLTWITSGASGDRITIVDRSRHRTWSIDSGEFHGFGYPEVGDGFVAWQESGNGFSDFGGFLFDVREGTLHGIGDESANTIDLTGRYLTWLQHENGVAVSRVVRLR